MVIIYEKEKALVEMGNETRKNVSENKQDIKFQANKENNTCIAAVRQWYLLDS